ncbi:hypothetical protein MRX96_053814, partial [Rhipicephalus microplus]
MVSSSLSMPVGTPFLRDGGRRSGSLGAISSSWIWKSKRQWQFSVPAHKAFEKAAKKHKPFQPLQACSDDDSIPPTPLDCEDNSEEPEMAIQEECSIS